MTVAGERHRQYAGTAFVHERRTASLRFANLPLGRFMILFHDICPRLQNSLFAMWEIHLIQSRYVDGLNRNEAARLLKVSTTTMKSRVWRARTRLKQMMSEL